MHWDILGAHLNLALDKSESICLFLEIIVLLFLTCLFIMGPLEKRAKSTIIYGQAFHIDINWRVPVSYGLYLRYDSLARTLLSWGLFVDLNSPAHGPILINKWATCFGVCAKYLTSPSWRHFSEISKCVEVSSLHLFSIAASGDLSLQGPRHLNRLCTKAIAL
jgi:hypothetical protein